MLHLIIRYVWQKSTHTNLEFFKDYFITFTDYFVTVLFYFMQSALM